MPTVERATAAVVLAAPGYPESPVTGATIEGLDARALQSPDVLVFHAGVADGGAGRLVTAGGRVMAIVGIGADVPGAAVVARTAAAEVAFPGIQWRRDIGGAPAAAGNPLDASDEARLVQAGAAPVGTAR